MKKFLNIYRERLKKDYEDPSGYFGSEDGYGVKEWDADYKHLQWMLEEIETMTDENKRNRWIGFVQGCCWQLGLFTIDEMREHVRELISKP
jgi:hypothetical protein